MSSPNPNLRSPSPLTSRVPLAPPVLPRLLWLHTHLLKWIWLGLYLVGLALMLYLTMMGRQYHIELTNMLPQSILGLTGCYLIVAICLLYAGEKEEHLHEFSLHRGWNPTLIHTSKITLALVSYAALIFALYLSREIFVWLANAKIERSITGNDISYALYTPALLLAWSLVGSHFADKLLSAIAITFIALIAQVPIIAFIIGDFEIPQMLIVNIILIATVLIVARHQTAELISRLSQQFSLSLKSPTASGSLPQTEHLPREQSQRFHLNWLHARQRRLTWVAGIAIVLFCGGIIPFNALVVDDGVSRVLLFSALPLFVFAAPLLTFQPEHAQSHYRFWNDRGLPWQSILRSRILGFLVPHVTILLLSLLALFLGFLLIFSFTPAHFTFSQAYAGLLESAQRDPQLLPPIWIALNLLLPIATITAFFYSWMFRSPLVAFVIQLLTLIALFAYASVTYVVLDIPLWLTLYPLAAILLYLTLTRFPQRFQPEIPTSLYRTNTLAIIATFIASLTATAFYRVYQVPDVTADLPVITDALLMHRLASSSSPQPPATSSTFQSQFDEINRNIPEYPHTQLANLSPSGLDSYHQYLVNNYGFDYALPSIQAWTIEHQPQAQRLKTLLLETPGSHLFVKNETVIGYAQRLLLYSAKYHESLNDLQTAAEFYIAHNRIHELFSLPTIGDPFRSHHRVALASWLIHPAQPIRNRDQLLLKMITRPEDAIPSQDRLTIIAHQIREKLIQTPTSQLIEEAKKDGTPHWSSRFYYLPTERWRVERLVMLWYKIQHMQLGIYAIHYLENRDFTTVDNNGNLSSGVNDLLQDGKLYEQLRQTTPLAGELAFSLQIWSPSQIQNLKNFADHHVLSYAHLVLTLAHTDLKLDPVPNTPAVASALEKLLSQTRLSPPLAEHLQKELRSREFTIAQNGIHPVNGQFNQPKYNLDTIGQQILILVDSTQPPYYTQETSNGRYLQIVNPELPLANLNHRPPIPDYDELAKLSSEQILDYFRNQSPIKPTPPAPALPELIPTDPFFNLPSINQ
jgi:hypothetical protein